MAGAKAFAIVGEAETCRLALAGAALEPALAVDTDPAARVLV